mgnify:CR=1 FL=1
MKYATCLLVAVCYSLSLTAQEPSSFWRKPTIQRDDTTYPVLCFTQGYSGLWLPDAGVVVVPEELLDNYTVDEANQVQGLRGAMVGVQVSLGGEPGERAAQRMRDSLTQTLATGSNEVVLWLESESRRADDAMLVQEVGTWKVRRRSPEYGIVILYSPELANYANRVYPEKSVEAWTRGDTLLVAGFPQYSHFIAPQARLRHYWSRVRPFQERILDSLGHDLPGPVSRQSYLYNTADPFYTLYRQQWPYQRTLILIDALTRYGHPLFMVESVLQGMVNRATRDLANPAYIESMHNTLQTIYEKNKDTLTAGNLARSLQLYFAETPGKLIAPVLAEAARFHQKDYHSLARTLLAKSRLANPDQWLPELLDEPQATLEALQTDYGFVLLSHLLQTTVDRAHHIYGSAQQALEKREQAYYRKEQRAASEHQANGSLRLARVVLDSGIPVQGTVAPGMSGAAVLNKDGSPAGVLLPCREDMVWGAWHPQMDLLCTRFVSVANILALLNG